MPTTAELLHAAIHAETEGERKAAFDQLCQIDSNAAMLLGLHRVGCGPEPGEKWVSYEPAPLGQLRPLPK